MKESVFEIIENARLTESMYKMVLSGDVSAVTAPGQFVNLALPGLYLRRPISVCDAEGGLLTLLYKVVGQGTAEMSQLPLGTELSVLTGLGNGYTTAASGASPLLAGGGAGVPPMYMLAKKLIAEGKKPTVVLGFNTGAEIFYEEEFKALGCDVSVTTVDGSYGTKGFVTAALRPDYTSLYACGPMPMLRALAKAWNGPASFSLEERMGCGFGACMGCSIKTKNGSKRVCKDGPVFDKEELLWED